MWRGEEEERKREGQHSQPLHSILLSLQHQQQVRGETDGAEGRRVEMEARGIDITWGTVGDEGLDQISRMIRYQGGGFWSD